MSAPCFAFDLVTFDVGRTLLTFRPDLARAYAEVLAEIGLEVDEARLEAALSAEWDAAARRRAASVPPDHRVSAAAGDERRRTFVTNVLRNAGVPDADLERSVAAVRDAYDTPRMYHVYDDAMPTIRGLWDRGLKLGVIANARPTISRVLLALGFGEYIGFWVISEVVGVEKPHPAIFERALALGGSEPSRALHVGDDYERDFLGARAAGMEAVLLDRDGSGPERDAEGRPVPSIRRLDELLNMIG
ncbi:HAD-IA family hydrolase [Sphaerobacter thermophilus]|jgi:putative hydrolase of the HAD superfamily|uniref:HAD-superfamily hydrolase, subfamily IA, variant 3 n=1 Tax=Sphaerobacter thermophilus (strain ATCC 49802 / DSM 20745 / KCCM 41009 / NCIMB 13125 / S 6022) TaxID=479434 RepID=D1CAR1_SPHTD|nr:HAD-IA family hydrolase [Sphaerobacter thermophilus]ACZ40904.1 HAD-superfamily hydrolase, subfamily IA, variant 3 [Sphaerobacter thermophilus DSM 20745]PZN62934.1 MAG: haloacid dehalogenase [Sphaerobacter thermophilus]